MQLHAARYSHVPKRWCRCVSSDSKVPSCHIRDSEYSRHALPDCRPPVRPCVKLLPNKILFVDRSNRGVFTPCRDNNSAPLDVWCESDDGGVIGRLCHDLYTG